jgi:hypothetical protein
LVGAVVGGVVDGAGVGAFDAQLSMLCEASTHLSPDAAQCSEQLVPSVAVIMAAAHILIHPAFAEASFAFDFVFQLAQARFAVAKCMCCAMHALRRFKHAGSF